MDVSLITENVNIKTLNNNITRLVMLLFKVCLAHPLGGKGN